MARRSIKGLQDKINSETKEGGSNNGLYYPHWKLPKDGVTKIRVLEDPDMENPLVVYREYLEHKLDVGEKEIIRIACPKNAGKEHNCPICDMSRKLYDNDDRTQGKYYYRDLFIFMRASVVKDGLEYAEGEESATGQVRTFKFSFQLVKKFKSDIGKLDPESEDDFWDVDNGIDFEIEKQIGKVKGEDMPDYGVGSGFTRGRSKPLSDEAKALITEDPLSDLIPHIPTYDETEELLQKHLRFRHGGGGDDSGEPDAEESEDEIMAKIQRQKDARKKAKDEPEDADEAEDTTAEAADDVSSDDDDDTPDTVDAVDDDDDDDDDDILRKLRSN
jgi:hypothetical protein